MKLDRKNRIHLLTLRLLNDKGPLTAEGLRLALRDHKVRIASHQFLPFIVELMPAHITNCEPFELTAEGRKLIDIWGA